MPCFSISTRGNISAYSIHSVYAKFSLFPTLFLFSDPLAYLATGCTVYTLQDASDLCGDGFFDITHEVTTPGCFNIEVGGHFQAAPSSLD